MIGIEILEITDDSENIGDYYSFFIGKIKVPFSYWDFKVSDICNLRKVKIEF